MKLTPLIMSSLSVMAIHSTGLAAQNTADTQNIERITITHILPESPQLLPGSAHVIDQEEIQIQRPFSVKEVLENVAGVNVVTEDVVSARLNIGIRGLNPRRSSRLLLLEDGVPLFLAPYGDPSASYSPPIEDLERIEVIKGAGQILYGPQTIGGMINFVSLPVPTDGLSGMIQGEAGNNNYQSGYTRLGLGNSKGGVVLSALDKRADGIREHHTLNIENYSLKGTWQIDNHHGVTAKIARFEESSRQSETGLSAAEYAADPYQAPTGKIDRYQQQRDTAQIVHDFTLSANTKLNTQLYHVEQQRASFRQINGPGEPIELCPATSGFSDTAGVEDAFTATESNSMQCGGRWRPREFTYYGIEPRLTLTHQWLDIPSEAVIGFRYHSEDISRHQLRGYDARFQQLDFARGYFGVDESEGRAGWHNEHIETEVQARTWYFQNSFSLQDWIITPGLRVENVTQTTDYLRTNGAAPTNADKRHTHQFTELLPGIGVTYNGLQDTILFTGLHKGFAPARPSREVDADEPDASFLATSPEQSWNFEAGIRSSAISGLYAEATLFYTDFSEIVIQTEAGRFINAGESQQAGLELAFRYDWATPARAAYNLYVEGNYTNLFLARFTNSQTVYDEEGEEILPTASFADGNRLPYAPRQMGTIAVGIQSPDRTLEARLAVNYTGEQYVDAANTIAPSDNGMEGLIPAYSLFNLSINYHINARLQWYMSGQNLTNKEYLASRVDGMVAGRKRQFVTGLSWQF